MSVAAFNLYKNQADILYDETGIKYDAKPYKETIKLLLDGLCLAMDEGDEHMKNLYVGALMVRFWNVPKNLMSKCPNLGLDEDDFVDWLYEAIVLACEYRKWQTDPTVNAQQCINQCVETIRVRKYYEFNLDKHSANYNTVSISNPVGDDEEQTSYEDRLYDEEEADQAKFIDGSASARYLIQNFINKKKLVEAIILDVIAFGDTIKTMKKTVKSVDENGETFRYTKYSHEFWAYKLIQLLSNLPDDYVDYFNDSYDVVPNEFNAALSVIRRANNQKLYREVRATLSAAKTLVQKDL